MRRSSILLILLLLGGLVSCQSADLDVAAFEQTQTVFALTQTAYEQQVGTDEPGATNTPLQTEIEVTVTSTPTVIPTATQAPTSEPLPAGSQAITAENASQLVSEMYNRGEIVDSFPINDTDLYVVQSLDGFYTYNAEDQLVAYTPILDAEFALDPNGRYVAFRDKYNIVISAPSEKYYIVTVWNLETGELAQVISHQAEDQYLLSMPNEVAKRMWNEVFGMAINPNGNLLAITYGEQSTLIYDIETGEEVKRFAEYWQIGDDIDFSADGEYLYIRNESYSIFLWEQQDDSLHVCNSRYNGGYISPYGVSPDHSKVVVYEEGKFSVYSILQNCTFIQAVLVDQEDVYEFSEDGSYIVGRSSGLAWDAETYQPVESNEALSPWVDNSIMLPESVLAAHSGGLDGLIQFSDQHVGGWKKQDDDVYVWDFSTNETYSLPSSVSLLGNIAGNDNQVYFCDASTGQLVSWAYVEDTLTSLDQPCADSGLVELSGNLLAFTTSSHTIGVMNLDTGAVIPESAPTSYPIIALAINDEAGNVLVTTDAPIPVGGGIGQTVGEVLHYQPDWDALKFQVFQLHNEGEAVSVTANGDYIAISDPYSAGGEPYYRNLFPGDKWLPNTGNTRLYLSTGSLLQSLEVISSAVALSPDGSLLAVHSTDGLFIYDPVSNLRVAELMPYYRNGAKAIDMVFAENNLYLLYESGVVVVWYLE